MPRKPRLDEPGTWHHVMNRGIARRTMFEGPQDMRRFLALLAAAVHHGDLEVVSYCLLLNHYHLLVRSPAGRLSHAMHRVQLCYSRWFNRTRARDGTLVRGRFESRPVSSLTYLYTLVSYVDGNVRHAGIARDATLYPFCSAFWYARARGPAWLGRRWIEEIVCRALRLPHYDPRGYRQVFPASTPAQRELVERRLAVRPTPLDPLDPMVEPGGAGILEWMRSRARVADGTEPLVPLAGAAAVTEALRMQGRRRRRSGAGSDALRCAEVGLLHQLCGYRVIDVARRLSVSEQRVGRSLRRHRELLRRDAAYANLFQSLARQALEITHRARRFPGVLDGAPKPAACPLRSRTQRGARPATAGGTRRSLLQASPAGSPRRRQPG